jgi:hypothetical protein
MDYDARMRPDRSVEASTTGRWGAVTALTPLKRCRTPLLRAVLWFGQKTTIAVTRLLRMRVIALARWTLLPPGKDPQYLLFETNWSGSRQSYIPDLAMLMRFQWKSIWGNVKGFPGPVPTTDLLEYIGKVDYGTDHYWSDYAPDATTQLVLSALELEPRFERFVKSSRGLAPDVLAARWRQFATASQRRPLELRASVRGLLWGEGPLDSLPEVAFLTPVAAERGEDLRTLLRALSAEGRESPFAGLSLGTHFARFVVIDIGEPHLLFTSRFDGCERDYLTALAAIATAREIWEHCVRPDPVDERSLREYLLEDRADRVPASYVVCALQSGDTVARIRAAMTLQDEVSSFATHSEGLDAIDLAHEFRELEPVRRIVER